jgi:cell division protein FtsI/penicillin-binding protein 2
MPPPQRQSFIDLLMKWGIAKTPEGAHRILVAIIIVALIITYYMVYSSVVDSNQLTGAQQQQLLNDLRAPALRHQIQK